MPRSRIELKHNGAMGTFIRRLVKKLGGKVTDEDGLHGFVGFYSGATKAGQSFEELLEDIGQQRWTGLNGLVLLQQSVQKHEAAEAATESASGLSASLDEAEYKAVASLMTNGEMAAPAMIGLHGFVGCDSGATSDSWLPRRLRSAWLR